jgi:hypothetical protein
MQIDEHLRHNLLVFVYCNCCVQFLCICQANIGADAVVPEAQALVFEANRDLSDLEIFEALPDTDFWEDAGFLFYPVRDVSVFLHVLLV